ncbi:glycoside hydrolase [Phytohabitans rumicis]|uniref:Alpha-mannosidase n=1 Tax=Phytohabitans rumicis TaxID=1076125 RepID=A0A6V8L083_9ACTN|nr:glycoside hydrolase [Phytohabitans rumicis]GFJ88161.1 alpha-mannosidase [Phytohabitans rumicis]
MTPRVLAVEGTDLFTGTASAPLQVMRVTLGEGRGPVTVRVEGPSVTTPEPVVVHEVPGVVEVGVRIAAPAPAGSVHRVTALVDDQPSMVDTFITAADTGWTMWMVSHFHYDPVWWNTQGGFTEVWHDLPWADRLRPPFVRTAFDLVRAHLEAARHDEDYRFVLAEIDYLKPYWDAFPGDRAELRRFLHEGRVELVGGAYNEPNTNLTHPESTIRNAVYGIGYQRDVLGGDPRSAWMLDVFGHDPAFPGLMADAGLDSSAWARGPFHHVGAKRHTGDITRMQFPSEFEWVSPSGRGLLTAYMANHYVAGWDIERKDTLDAAMAEAYAQFRELKRVAATRNVLLPVGHDHNVPSRWCTEIHRHWAKRYVWPRFVVGLPRDFFAAVRADLAHSGRSLSPQTRDMNPVYTGKDVSYIDTKQAQRAGEVAVLDAERLSTVATLFGHRFPAEALDKAWRQLAYGAHHDAVTGTESDQVYLDLLGGWREAYEWSAGARDAAVRAIGEQVGTAGPGRPVLVVNPLSWARDGVTTVRLAFDAPGPQGVAVASDDGEPVKAVSEGVCRHPDGTLAEVTLSFLARAVPPVGYRVYRVLDAPDVPAGWTRATGHTASNDAFLVAADPARGGALSRVLDRRTGRELLRPGGLGGALVRQEEHDSHPRWGEGPWHLLPKGPGHGAGPAEVYAETSPVGSRVVSVADLGDLRARQEVTLWDGVDRVDFRTHVDGSIGQDHLLRVRFDLDAPGALPVSEVGFAAIGRSFGFPNSDAAEHLWTLDNPAHTWAGLSATARIRVRLPDGSRQEHAIGVAEVIADAPARDLLVRLAAIGVTATGTRPDGQRYGALDADSNLPDVRIALGAGNSFAAAVLESAGPAYREALARTGKVFVPADRSRRAAWTPDADLRGPRDLPVLVVAGEALDVDGTAIDAAGVAPVAEPFGGHSVALVNHGTPSFVAEPDGTLYLSLMRSCSAWPCGVWIDGPRRTAPDGSSFAWQHWTHTFRYSLVAGAGDWRDAGFVRAGQEVNHPVHATEVPAAAGPLPASLSLASVEPETVVLAALKPRGNPMASGQPNDGSSGVTFRLYESAGAPATATVRLHGGLDSAVATDLLEGTARGPLTVDGEAAVVDLAAADVVTVGAQPLLLAAGAALGPARAERAPASRVIEPAQPVYTRYWLHNKGPAPVGYLPVSVHVEPTSIAPGGTVLVRVASGTRAAAGVVDLDVPAGLTVTPDGPLPYDLAAGEHAEFAVRVRADGAPAGTYFVGARIRDDLGQVLEDVVAVAVGEAGVPLDVVLDAEPLRLAPGVRADLAVRLDNRSPGEIRGEAQLVSPYGTWGGPDCGVAITPWTQGFAVPAGGSTRLRYEVAAPATARPGSHWWALVKVVYFGRLHYTEAVPVEIRPAP